MTDIAPITIGHITIHRFAPLQQQRKQIFRKVGFFFVGEIIEDFWFENIGSGVDGIGKNLAGGWFFDKTANSAFFVGNHYPKFDRIGNPRQDEGCFRVFAFMECDRFLQVKIGNTIATNHQKGII